MPDTQLMRDVRNGLQLLSENAGYDILILDRDDAITAGDEKKAFDLNERATVAAARIELLEKQLGW